MPRDRAAIPALAQKLRGQGNKDLAGQYMSIYGDKYQWDQQQAFHAFEWPSPFPAILTDVVVRDNAYPTSEMSGGALHAIATSTVSELRKAAATGDKIAAPVRETFPDGLTSYRIEMRVKLDKSYGAAASYNIIYIFFGRKKPHFYQLFVRGEAGLGGLYQKTADGIASHFLPD